MPYFIGSDFSRLTVKQTHRLPVACRQVNEQQSSEHSIEAHTHAFTHSHGTAESSKSRTEGLKINERNVSLDLINVRKTRNGFEKGKKPCSSIEQQKNRLFIIFRSESTALFRRKHRQLQPGKEAISGHSRYSNACQYVAVTTLNDSQLKIFRVPHSWKWAFIPRCA